jgi:ureidoacrylate peracid hydrolase
MTERLSQLTSLDALRCALLVIDMQVGFLDPGEPVAVDGALAIVPRINRIAAALRGAGGAVAFTRHCVEGDPARALPPWERALIPDSIAERFVPGAASHALHPALDVKPGDLVIDKYRYSALAARSSTLDAELRLRGIETLIIAGTITNVCCESTARDGHSLDYRTLFLADTTAAATAGAQSASLSTLGSYFAYVLDSEALLGLLGRKNQVGRS